MPVGNKEQLAVCEASGTTATKNFANAQNSCGNCEKKPESTLWLPSRPSHLQHMDRLYADGHMPTPVQKKLPKANH